MPWHNFTEYGLIGLMICAITFLLFTVVKWTLQTTKEILAQASEERKLFAERMSDIKKSFDEHTNQARIFHESVVEAHRMQRAEHERLADKLDHICVSLGKE